MKHVAMRQTFVVVVVVVILGHTAQPELRVHLGFMSLRFVDSAEEGCAIRGCGINVHVVFAHVRMGGS